MKAMDKVLVDLESSPCMILCVISVYENFVTANLFYRRTLVKVILSEAFREFSFIDNSPFWAAEANFPQQTRFEIRSRASRILES